MTTGNGEITEAEPQDSPTNHEKDQLLENRLKEIQVELRKNNEEIKILRETMLRSWKLLRTAVKKNGVFAAPSIQQTAQHLLEKKRKSTEAADSEPIQQQAAQQLNTTVVTTNTHENEAPKPPTPPNNDKLKAREPDATMFKIHKPKRFRPSPSGGS
ncbi:hypothetical protein ACOSQ2_013515 [Xanthoceras sorbifolium]